jgi:hypothetical protein
LKLQFANQSFDYVIASDWGVEKDNTQGIQSKEKSLQFLKSLTSNLILFASSPKYPVFESCISSKFDATLCAGTRSLALDARYATLAKSSGGQFFPSNDFLCVGTVCPAIIQNKFVTRGDGSHITAAIAREWVLPFKIFLGFN